MQPTFDLESAPPLPRLRDDLLAYFGPRTRGARLDPISQLVKSLISARTADMVTADAFAQLHGAFPDWTDLAAAAPKRVEAAISAVTFADRKARQLPVLIRVIQIRTGGLDLGFLADWPVEEAMAWLQSLPGVGVKSAAAALNFSTLNRPTLVVDTHVHRVARRLGLAGRGSEPSGTHAALMALTPRTWSAEALLDLHWLLKRLGQSICTDAPPRCGMCPLNAACPRVGVGVGRKVLEFSISRRKPGDPPEAVARV